MNKKSTRQLLFCIYEKMLEINYLKKDQLIK